MTHTLFAQDGIVSIMLIGYVAGGAEVARDAYDAAASSAGFDIVENPEGIGIPGIENSSGFRGDESVQLAATDDSNDAEAAGRTQISVTYGLISES